MGQCIYYQNLCQRPCVDDYTARHYCKGAESRQCRAHKDITRNLLKFLSDESNVDFLDEAVRERLEVQVG